MSKKRNKKSVLRRIDKSLDVRILNIQRMLEGKGFNITYSEASKIFNKIHDL